MLIVDSQVHIWENIMLNPLHRHTGSGRHCRGRNHRA